MHTRLYREARTYEIAFSYRDVPAELDFLLQAYRAATQRPLTRALELACGPAYHATELAARGVAAVALDLSPDMVAQAEHRAAQRGLALQGVVADMTDFRLELPVDLALNLLTSITYITRIEDLQSHMRCVAGALAMGGVYVVETNHPRDFLSGDHFKPSVWEMEEHGVSVRTTWVAEPPLLRFARNTYEVLARYEVNDHGVRHTLEDRAELRMLWPDELRLAAQQAGLTQVAAYGGHDVNLPMDDSQASWRLLAVFRRDG